MVLKFDEVSGAYCCVDAEQAAELWECLDCFDVHFVLEAPSVPRLAGPGERVFVLGTCPAYQLGDILSRSQWQIEIDSQVPAGPAAYPAPLDLFFNLGQPPDFENWRSYAHLGIALKHTPDLIRLATDWRLHGGPAGCAALWAAPHAWRALAQLRTADAIEPLLSILPRSEESNDARAEQEIPLALGKIGPATIPALDEYLANPARGEWARAAAAQALARVALIHPEANDECIRLLARRLEQSASNPEALNRWLINALLDLRAVAAAPIMQRVFASGRIDEGEGNDDWEDVQIKLGLKLIRDHAKKLDPVLEQLMALWHSAKRPMPSSAGAEGVRGRRSWPPVA